MAYECRCSSHNPQLLVLLTDESEESAVVVNHVVDFAIRKHYDGMCPKNRMFFFIIGYRKVARIIASGYLDYLDRHPIRVEMNKKKISDGAGGLVEVNFSIPIWVEGFAEMETLDYKNAVSMAHVATDVWTKVKPNAPSPIIIDCAACCCANAAKKEIHELKQVSSIDGKALFFGCYKDMSRSTTELFSCPIEWIQARRILIDNEDDNLLNCGLFSYASINCILYSLCDEYAGECALNDITYES